MDVEILIVFKIVLITAGPHVSFAVEEQFLSVPYYQSPHSNVKLTLIIQQWSFNVLLHYELTVHWLVMEE